MRDGDIIINGIYDTYTQFGVCMGDGFLDELDKPLTPKAFIENESRLEHGKRIEVQDTFFKARELTLTFVLWGDGATIEEKQQSLQERKSAFLQEIYNVNVSLCIPKEKPGVVYHLLYKDIGSEYSRNPMRTMCKMMLKFEEPNPTIRTGTAKERGE